MFSYARYFEIGGFGESRASVTLVDSQMLLTSHEYRTLGRPARVVFQFGKGSEFDEFLARQQVGSKYNKSATLCVKGDLDSKSGRVRWEGRGAGGEEKEEGPRERKEQKELPTNWRGES